MTDTIVNTTSKANAWDKIFILLLAVNLIFIFYNFNKVTEQTNKLADAQIQTAKILENRTIYFDELKTILINQGKVLDNQQLILNNIKKFSP